jgi:hypothetical protein
MGLERLKARTIGGFDTKGHASLIARWHTRQWRICNQGNISLNPSGLPALR